jgi:hypothetical protein
MKKDVAKARVIAAVGITLAFETKTGVGTVRLSGFADQIARKIPSVVELHTVLGCTHGEDAAGAGFAQAGNGNKFGGGINRGGRWAPDEVEIAMFDGKVGEGISETARMVEIIGFIDGNSPAEKSNVLVDGNDRVGVDLKLVVGDGAGALAREIKIGMIRETQRGNAVGNGLRVDMERVVARQGIGDRDVNRSRVTFLAVRAPVRETQGWRAVRSNDRIRWQRENSCGPRS